MRQGRPSASWPGISVSPSVLTAKMTIRTISGARMRRRTRKIVAEAWVADAIGTRRRRHRPLRALLVWPSNSRVQKTSSGLPMRRPQRRWNDTVSTTSSTTDTMLATSAPPDSDTTLAVASRVSPSTAT